MADGKRDAELEKAIEAIVSKFRKFDVNGDGVINQEELVQVLEHMDQAFWSSSNVFRLMHEIDENHDGQIEYEEFVRWSLTHATSSGKDAGRKRRRRKSAVEKTFGKIPAGKFEGSDMVMAKADAARAAIRAEEVEDAVGPSAGLEPEGAAVVLDALIEMMRGIDPIVQPMCTPSGMTGSKFFLTPTSATATPLSRGTSGLNGTASRADPCASPAAADGGSPPAFGPQSPTGTGRSLRRLPTFRGHNAWRQLVHDPDAFIASLRHLSTAVSGGWIPGRNINRARVRLSRESENEEGEVVQEADLARKSPVRIISLLCIYVETLIEFADITDIVLAPIAPPGDSAGPPASRVEDEHPTLTLPKRSASPSAPPPTETSGPPAADESVEESEPAAEKVEG
mmetsp:Transcript_165086/g.292314  ORF Transcript_165086/g.292314 Transcript_165086/m.292314 type:complete len:397 (+) Transcript_165086:42-1232(+)